MTKPVDRRMFTPEYCEICGSPLLERDVPSGFSRLTGVAQFQTMHVCPQARPESAVPDRHDYHRALGAGCILEGPRPVSPKPPSRPNPLKAEERGLLKRP